MTDAQARQILTAFAFATASDDDDALMQCDVRKLEKALDYYPDAVPFFVREVGRMHAQRQAADERAIYHAGGTEWPAARRLARKMLAEGAPSPALKRGLL